MFLDSEKIGQKTYKLSAGGGGSQTLMSCCSVNFDELTIHPLLELMPPVLLLQGSTAGDTMLPTLLHAMADEVMEQRGGGCDRIGASCGCGNHQDWLRFGTQRLAAPWLLSTVIRVMHGLSKNLRKSPPCPAQCFAIDLPQSSGCRRRVTLRDRECIWRAVGWAMSALQWPKRRSGSVTSRKRRSAVPSNVSQAVGEHAYPL